MRRKRIPSITRCSQCGATHWAYLVLNEPEWGASLCDRCVRRQRESGQQQPQWPASERSGGNGG